jgi:hypothetical protein
MVLECFLVGESLSAMTLQEPIDTMLTKLVLSPEPPARKGSKRITTVIERTDVRLQVLEDVDSIVY